jgi:hypothetical protein
MISFAIKNLPRDPPKGRRGAGYVIITLIRFYSALINLPVITDPESLSVTRITE